MLYGWWYRSVSVAGTVGLSVVAAGVAFIVAGPSGTPQAGGESLIPALAVFGLVVGLSLLELYRPRPRRTAAMIAATISRVTVACVVLVLVGTAFFPAAVTPSAVGGVGLLLAVVLPPFYWAIGRRRSPGRILLVGNDPATIQSAATDLSADPLGFVSPRLGPTTDVPAEAGTESVTEELIDPGSVAVTDGSGAVTVSHYDGVVEIAGLDRLGGLARLRDLVPTYDVDTLVLGFRDADRGEFFGTLEIAHEYGLNVFAHESHADSVLVADERDGSLLEVDVDLWPWYSVVAKRTFDVCFAALALMVATPLIVLITVAIKVDSPGPVFYQQTRSSAFGGTFTVLKFRSMVVDAENETGAILSDEDAGEIDPRVTTVGRLLRKTHLDEIPQLGSVLVGDMSVVGPRPERPIFDAAIMDQGHRWEKRWLLKPGLTGPAQANGVTSVDPDEKLALDLAYARRQSMHLDALLVWRQVRVVVGDFTALVRERVRAARSDSRAD